MNACASGNDDQWDATAAEHACGNEVESLEGSAAWTSWSEQGAAWSEHGAASSEQGAAWSESGTGQQWCDSAASTEAETSDSAGSTSTPDRWASAFSMAAASPA